MFVAITEDGLLINDKLIEYKDLHQFYIIYYPPEIKNLYFRPKGNLKQRITIPLMDQDPVLVREALLKYLDENLEREETPASEAITKLFKL